MFSVGWECPPNDLSRHNPAKPHGRGIRELFARFSVGMDGPKAIAAVVHQPLSFPALPTKMRWGDEAGGQALAKGEALVGKLNWFFLK